MKRGGCDGQTALHSAVAETAVTVRVMQQVVALEVVVSGFRVVVVALVSFVGEEIGAVNRFDVLTQ